MTELRKNPEHGAYKNTSGSLLPALGAGSGAAVAKQTIASKRSGAGECDIILIASPNMGFASDCAQKTNSRCMVVLPRSASVGQPRAAALSSATPNIPFPSSF